MKKENMLLVFKINEKDADLFIEKLKEYKKNLSFSNVLLFYEFLSKNSVSKIDEVYKCIYIKETKFIKAKFEIFKYLDKYKSVIFMSDNNYLDLDEIEKYKNYSFASILYNNRFVEANFKRFLRKYNMFQFSFDTSIMIINDKLLNYENISDWCIKHSFLYYFYLANRVDGILDLMIQEFNIDVTLIDNKKSINILEKYDAPRQKIQKQKNNKDLISVVMPVYNRIDTIELAIKSILNQTYKNFELIVIVEYSGNQKKINEIINKINDSRIKVINNKEKLGLAKSLNVGIDNCRGNYIARMDDDDISDYKRFEKQLSYLKSNNDIAIVGSYMKFFGNSNLICELPTNPEILKVKALYKTPLFHPTVMFNLYAIPKSEIVYNINSYAEDYYLWSRLVEKYKISNLPEVLYYYNLSGNNLSTKNEKKMNNSHLDIMNYQLENYLSLNLSFDQLQLLSGRIDVLGNCKNLKYAYKRKKKIWLKIAKVNKKKRFYNQDYINNEIFELDNYYKLIYGMRMK